MSMPYPPLITPNDVMVVPSCKLGDFLATDKADSPSVLVTGTATFGGLVSRPPYSLLSVVPIRLPIRDHTDWLLVEFR